jgi:hypothetical protein
MLKSRLINKKAIKVCALTLSFSTIISSFTSVSAQPNRYRTNTFDLENSNLLTQKENTLFLGNYRQNPLQAQSLRILDENYNDFRNPRRRYRRDESFSRNLPAGTTIKITYRNARKILVTTDEVAPIILEVAKDVRDRGGNVVIPRGSEIVGEIRPSGRRGSRFEAEAVILPNGDEYSLAARSRVIDRTERYGRDYGYNNNTWRDTAAGLAAAAIIGGISRDQGLNTRGILGDAISRIIFGGDRYYNNDRYDDRYYDYDLIAIYPDKDLDLTLTQAFYFDDFYRNY